MVLIQQGPKEHRLMEAYQQLRNERHEDKFWHDLVEGLKARDYDYNQFSVKRGFDTLIEGGESIRKTWEHNGRGGFRLYEAGPNAVTTAAFTNVFGQVIYSAFLDAFNQPQLIGDRLVRVIPTKFQNGEKIPGVSLPGDQALQVNEGESYPYAGLSESWVQTPSLIKRGMIIAITKEVVLHDNTRMVLERAQAVGQMIAINREKRILDVVLGITTSYSRNGGAAQATYGDTHTEGTFDNLAATNGLVDYTDVENAWLLFDGMTDPDTGEPIVIDQSRLKMIVPSALRMTAARIQNATSVAVGDTTSATVPVTTSPSPLPPFGVESNSYVKARSSSATTWWYGDFQGAFAYMEGWPATVTTASANDVRSFEADIVAQYKGSEYGAAAVIEPRKAVKSTA